MYKGNLQVNTSIFKNPIFVTLCIVIPCIFIARLVRFFAVMLFYFFGSITTYVTMYFLYDVWIFFVVFIIFLCLFVVLGKKKKDVTYTEIFKEKGFLKKVILFSFIGWCFIEALTHPIGVVVNYKKPDRISFAYSLINDISQNKTTVAFVSSKEIEVYEVDCNLYGLNKIDCVNFFKDNENNDGYRYQSFESPDTISIIENLKKYEKEVTIEYYTNTGVIKKIDGIDKSNNYELKERVKELKKDSKYIDYNYKSTHFF